MHFIADRIQEVVFFEFHHVDHVFRFPDNHFFSLAQAFGKAVGETLEELLSLVTGYGALGWMGIGLIAAGLLFTFATAGWGFPIGGLLGLIGFILIGFDKLANAISDALIDWIISDARTDPDENSPMLAMTRQKRAATPLLQEGFIT